MAEEGGGVGGGFGGVGTTPLTLADAATATDTAEAPSGGGDCAMTTSHSSGAGGRLYPCPYCEKVFRHPRSYYQHQHVHRGTHSCPGCGKLFSRRWDLLRHLNKNKYGCPARWREGGTRHPPYHNSLSLSALASAAAVAASSQESTTVPPEPPDTQQQPPRQQQQQQPVVHQSAPWTVTGGCSNSSGSNGEPRPPEPPAASRSSP